jgi:hypothetical protein
MWKMAPFALFFKKTASASRKKRTGSSQAPGPPGLEQATDTVKSSLAKRFELTNILVRIWQAV